MVGPPVWAHAQQASWKFVVFGDSLSLQSGVGLNTNILAELAHEVVARQPSLLLYLGDFSVSGSAESLSVWTNVMTPVFEAGIPIYPVIGNHDYITIPALSNVFGAFLPNNGPLGEESSTYAVHHENALIVVLNQFAPSNQYRINQPWLEAVLSTNKLPHVFAAGHMPAFKVYHSDCLNYFPTNRDVFWNCLSNANARVYFSGHDHFYDVARLDDGDGAPGNDLHQVIIGTGGAPLYPEGVYNGTNGSWVPLRLAHEQNFGYVSVEVTGERFSITRYNRTGPGAYTASPEVFSFSAEPGCLLRHAQSTDGVTLSWSGPAVLQAAPEVGGLFTNVPGARSPYVITNIKNARSFYRLMLP